MDKSIYMKRLLARIFDILVPTIITLFGLFFYTVSNELSLKELDREFTIIIIFVFFILFMFISIMKLKNRTYGDLLMKIKLVPLNKDHFNIYLAFSREIYFIILLFITFEYSFGWIALVINLFPMGKSKKDKTPLIILDIICKSTYISDRFELVNSQG